MRWQEEGKDPDYRFSLANERTYLAWIRTALAVLAGAVLLQQFVTNMQPRWLLLGLAGALSALAGVIGAAAYFRWRGNEHAMRLSAALPRPALIPVVSIVLVLMACATVSLVMRS